MSHAHAKAVAAAMQREMLAIQQETPRLSAKRLARDPAKMMRLGAVAVEAYRRFDQQAESDVRG